MHDFHVTEGVADARSRAACVSAQFSFFPRLSAETFISCGFPGFSIFAHDFRLDVWMSKRLSSVIAASLAWRAFRPVGRRTCRLSHGPKSIDS